MADRQSAYLFGEIFEILASRLETEHQCCDTRSRLIAQDVYNLTADFDFLDYQMEIEDEILQDLEVERAE